jgi:hypothetical protein
MDGGWRREDPEVSISTGAEMIFLIFMMVNVVQMRREAHPAAGADGACGEDKEEETPLAQDTARPGILALDLVRSVSV